MTRLPIRRGPWIVALAIGAAAVGYLVRALPATRWGGSKPGVWDLTLAVVTEPRFLVVVCFTSMLVASVLRREAVLPELIRLGSWRAYLAREAAGGAKAVVPSVLTVLAVCAAGAALTGSPWQSVRAPNSTAEVLAAAGLPGPLGVLAQVAQATLALTVLHLALTALRITTGSIGPVVAVALVLFSWSSVSVLALVTTITADPSTGQTSSVSNGLDANAVVAFNTITYLNLPAAISAGLPVVAAGLGLLTGLAFATATVLDLRVERARRHHSHDASQHAH